MKETHTILCPPDGSHIHFELLEAAVKSEGYRLEILPEVDREAVDEGLKYVNNDACYPAIIVIGQLMQALKSGRYDLDNTTVIISPDRRRVPGYQLYRPAPESPQRGRL